MVHAGSNPARCPLMLIPHRERPVTRFGDAAPADECRKSAAVRFRERSLSQPSEWLGKHVTTGRVKAGGCQMVAEA